MSSQWSADSRPGTAGPRAWPAPRQRARPHGAGAACPPRWVSRGARPSGLGARTVQGGGRGGGRRGSGRACGRCGPTGIVEQRERDPGGEDDRGRDREQPRALTVVQRSVQHQPGEAGPRLSGALGDRAHEAGAAGGGSPGVGAVLVAVFWPPRHRRSLGRLSRRPAGQESRQDAVPAAARSHPRRGSRTLASACARTGSRSSRSGSTAAGAAAPRDRARPFG